MDDPDNNAAKTIFQPLREVFETKQYTIIDFMRFIGQLSAKYPKIAYAACIHAADIFEEHQNGGICTFSYVLAEMYWRIFFNKETAEAFGTDAIVNGGEEVMKAFTKYMIECLQMDDLQDAKNTAGFPPCMPGPTFQ